MTQPTPNVDPANKGRPMYDEADIGSGEKSPGQHETEEMIREIAPLRQSGDEKEEGKNSGSKDGAAA